MAGEKIAKQNYITNLQFEGVEEDPEWGEETPTLKSVLHILHAWNVPFSTEGYRKVIRKLIKFLCFIRSLHRPALAKYAEVS